MMMKCFWHQKTEGRIQVICDSSCFFFLLTGIKAPKQHQSFRFWSFSGFIPWRFPRLMKENLNSLFFYMYMFVFWGTAWDESTNLLFEISCIQDSHFKTKHLWTEFSLLPLSRWSFFINRGIINTQAPERAALAF